MTKWLHAREEAGVIVFRVGRDRGAVVAEWPGVGEFRSDRSPAFVPELGADPDQARKIERGAACAIRRYLEGKASLHCAAVEIDDRGIVLLGESGAGKSTTAALLVAQGGALIADDVLGVEVRHDGIELIPGESEHWVDATARSLLGIGGGDRQKAPLRASAVGLRPVPLGRIFLLRVDPAATDVEISPLCGREAMRAVACAMIQLPLGHAGRQLQDFERVERLCREGVLVATRPPGVTASDQILALVRNATLDTR